MTSGFSGFQNRVSTTTEARQKTEQGLMCTTDRVVHAMANDATIELLVRVGSPILHVLPSISFTGTAELFTFEAPTVIDPGTAQPIFNRNRNSTYAELVTVFHTPSLSADGLQLDELLLPGGSGGNSQGNQGGFEVEWILKPNTDYLYRAVNIAGNAQSGHLHIDFYEAPRPIGPVR